MARVKLEVEFKEVFDTLANELRKDKGYYIAWQANIACALVDTLEKAGYRFPKLRHLANEAAKNFINLLIWKAKPDQDSIKPKKVRRGKK